MTTTIDPFKSFKRDLEACIMGVILRNRNEGTTAMSRDNLFMIVRAPHNGPTGTNARWVYRQMFNEAIDNLPSSYRRDVLTS